MSSPQAGALVAEKPPVSPGCLPAWEMGDMPAPVSNTGWRVILGAIGPSLVMVGGTIGTGEWVTGAGVAALYLGAMLWVAPLAILAQVMLNTEAMRYTLVTGEPIFTGFMRSRPGPRFWLTCYLGLDLVGWLPALAGLAAQILMFTILGQQTPSAQQTAVAGCAILATCGFLLCFGGKVYNTLEYVLGGKVFFVLFYLLFVTLFFVPWEKWQLALTGMFTLRIPDEGIKWDLVGAVAGLAGIGGMGNILASNYVREKGWGMGAKVGAIASAFGGHKISLSHLGTMARPDEHNVERFRLWWKRVSRDQFGLWAWGSVLGMLLPAVLGLGYLKNNYFVNKTSELNAAAALAQDFGAVHGPVFTYLTLLCGFAILFPGVFSSMDGIARRWCDAFWSGSRRARAAEPHKVRYLYYSFIGAYVTIGFILNGFQINPARMMVFNANLANFSITCCMLHTLYVNTHFLPEAFRPSTAKRLGLLMAAAFYATIFLLVTNQTIQKAMAGTLFPK